MNTVVDSSGWLEYFADSKNAKNFAKAIENTAELIIPVISLYEVFKKILHAKGEHAALLAIAHMKQGKVIDLDMDIALLAAKLAEKNRLPMADSLILATAKRNNAIVLTQDSDFKGLEGVQYFSKN